MYLFSCNFISTFSLILVFVVTGTVGLVTNYISCHGIGVKLKAEILNTQFVGVTFLICNNLSDSVRI